MGSDPWDTCGITSTGRRSQGTRIPMATGSSHPMVQQVNPKPSDQEKENTNVCVDKPTLEPAGKAPRSPAQPAPAQPHSQGYPASWAHLQELQGGHKTTTWGWDGKSEQLDGAVVTEKHGCKPTIPPHQLQQHQQVFPDASKPFPHQQNLIPPAGHWTRPLHSSHRRQCRASWVEQEVGQGCEAPGPAWSWWGTAPQARAETHGGFYSPLQARAGLHVPCLLHRLDKERWENTHIPTHARSPGHSGTINSDKPTPLPATTHLLSPQQERKGGAPPLKNAFL